MFDKVPTNLIGRILLAPLFLLSGVSKIFAFSGTQAYMEAVGVPGFMLVPTIILEIAASIAIIIGFQARIASILLAGFTLIAAVMFHSDFADQNQMIHFLKNIAVAGGLLLVFNHGASAPALDARKAT